MKWALILDGAVAETTAEDPEGRFAPELVWLPCPAEVAERWRYEGVAFTPPPGPVALSAAAVRAERDTRLAACDWTQLPDAPDSTRVAWALYRAALRAVPQQAGFPTDVAWPEPPA